MEFLPDLPGLPVHASEFCPEKSERTKRKKPSHVHPEKGRPRSMRKSGWDATAELDFVSGVGGVFRETFHGIEGNGIEREADHLGRFAEDVVRHRDDFAAALLGLENVEDFARAR